MDDHRTPAEIAGHEITDAEIAPIVRFAIFLGALTVLISLMVIGLYRYLDAREVAEKTGRYPLAHGVTRPLPPPPRLQTYPFDDIKALRREENRLLEHYAWVDRNAGVVRIPIERAMEVLAEKGLPYRTDAAGAARGEAAAAVHAAPDGAKSQTPEKR